MPIFESKKKEGIRTEKKSKIGKKYG